MFKSTLIPQFIVFKPQAATAPTLGAPRAILDLVKLSLLMIAVFYIWFCQLCLPLLLLKHDCSLLLIFFLRYNIWLFLFSICLRRLYLILGHSTIQKLEVLKSVLLSTEQSLWPFLFSFLLWNCNWSHGFEFECT
jgi:hypothetical protein